MFGEQYLIPLIAQYLADHPEVTVNALLVDRLVNMVDEGVEVAIHRIHAEAFGPSALRRSETEQQPTLAQPPASRTASTGSRKKPGGSKKPPSLVN